jgi:hypothetical protein
LPILARRWLKTLDSGFRRKGGLPFTGGVFYGGGDYSTSPAPDPDD